MVSGYQTFDLQNTEMKFIIPITFIIIIALSLCIQSSFFLKQNSSVNNNNTNNNSSITTNLFTGFIENAG